MTRDKSKREDGGLKATPVADYMKIRHYVVSMVERGAVDSAMIPSMNELAKAFGVTRMTVHKALKDLIRDNYLVVRKGIGTFINPSIAKLRAKTPSQRCVGIVVGNGKHCFYDAYYWDLISAFGKEICARRYNVNLINLTGSKPEGIVQEVRNNWVDGLIWIDPSASGDKAKSLKLLHGSGFPCVGAQSSIEGVNCVDMDWERHAYESGRALLAEGRRNVVFADWRDIASANAQLDGLRRAFEEAGVRFNERLVLKDSGDQEALRLALEEVLEFGIEVQAVYVSAPNLKPVLATLRKHGVDLERACRILAEPFFLNEAEGFRGSVRLYRFEEEAKIAVDMLERMLFKNDFSVERTLLEFKVAACPQADGANA